MMNVTAIEKDVQEQRDGSYIAYVDLIDVNSGRKLGGASALCSIDEANWRNRDKFARRSMAVTRATSKAYRLSYGWIMALAGYEGTPVEEMIEVETVEAVELFDKNNSEQVDRAEKWLLKRNVPAEYHLPFVNRLHGRPVTENAAVLKDVLASV